MHAPPKVLPMFVSSTYRITKLHFTYGYARLSAAYVGYLDFKNHLLTPHIYVSNLKWSLCLYVLRTVITGYTIVIGV